MAFGEALILRALPAVVSPAERSIVIDGEIVIYHTVHIAFGTNIGFGGTNKADCHMDGIIKNPTLYLDDILVLKDGEFQI